MIEAGLDAGLRAPREADQPVSGRVREDEAPAPPSPLPGTLFAGLIGSESPAIDALWDWARLIPPLIPMSLAVAFGELVGDSGVLEAPPVEAPLEPGAAPAAVGEPIVEEAAGPAATTTAPVPEVAEERPAPSATVAAPEAPTPAAADAATEAEGEPDTSGLSAWSSRVAHGDR